MSQERSVRFSGKLRRIGAGTGALAALAALIGSVALLGASESDSKARTPPVASPSAPSTGAPFAPRVAPRAAANHGPTRALAMHSKPPSAHAVARLASPATEPRPMSAERARLVETAQRELQLLEVQDPRNFLALFDLMREDAPGQDKALEAGRSASHAYILARMRVLERMLRRFIDDPDGDRTLETDALARIDADFKRTIDSLARDVPPLANVQEILTSTMLKAPAFTDPIPESD